MNTNNSIEQNINDRIAMRACEITKLINDVRAAIGDNGSVEVVIDGKQYRLVSDTTSANPFGHSDNVSATFKDGEYWKVCMIETPNKGWRWECLADKVWDHKSTDVETLSDLKWRFDYEKEEMNVIRKVLIAHTTKHSDALDFFGVRH